MKKKVKGATTRVFSFQFLCWKKIKNLLQDKETEKDKEYC